MDIEDIERIRQELAPAYRDVNGASLSRRRFAREFGVDERKYQRLLDGDLSRGGVSRTLATLARFMAATPVEHWPEWEGDDDR